MGRMDRATHSKLKVSLTLDADLVALVDRDARRRGATRSGVVERWLRRAAVAGAKEELEESTAAYYRSLLAEDREEDEALARASSAAARRLTIDEGSSRRIRRGRG